MYGNVETQSVLAVVLKSDSTILMTTNVPCFCFEPYSHVRIVGSHGLPERLHHGVHAIGIQLLRAVGGRGGRENR